MYDVTLWEDRVVIIILHREDRVDSRTNDVTAQKGQS